MAFDTDLKEYLAKELKRSALRNLQLANRLVGTHPRLTTIFLADFFFALAFVLFLCKIWQKSHRPEPVFSSDHAVLRVLFNISTPTSLAQPSDLRWYLESTNTRKPLRLEINLLKLLDNILAGQLELRDPSDICYLIKGQLRVYGWSVEFSTDTRWSIKVMKWIAEEHLFLSRAYIQPTPNESLSRNTKTTADHRLPYFDLDFVRYVALKAEIGRIKLLQMQAGSSITIDFSCLAAHVGFSTKYFMLCVVPFLPRALKKMQTQRTPTALLVRSADIISLFSTGPLLIESLTNISHEHASLLQFKEQELINNFYARGKCIRDRGKAGWREERFMLVLEAGLLLSGLLIRWRLILRK